jgi:hypothetical protein
MTDHLLREHAPISNRAWRLIDEEFADRAAELLRGRDPLVSGPDQGVTHR